SIDGDILAHETRVATKACSPELVAQHRDGILFLVIVRGPEYSAELRPHAEHGKERSGCTHRRRRHDGAANVDQTGTLIERGHSLDLTAPRCEIGEVRRG